MTQPSLSISSAPKPRTRDKVTLGLLACWFGWMGGHWWYLGRRYAWLVTLAAALCLISAFVLFPVWYDNPAFFLLLIPLADGYIESIVFSLMPDEKFDRLYNPGAGRVSQTGWGPVLVAVSSMFIGAIVCIFGIAMVVMYVSIASGWLDGYTF